MIVRCKDSKLSITLRFQTSVSFVIYNVHSFVDVYQSPSAASRVLFSLPRGTVFSVSTIIRSVDGVWVRCVSTKGNGRDNEKTLADSMIYYSNNYWLEWILVGKLNDNPMCCPANKSVYQSRWPLGKAYHMVKISPSTKETVCYKIPGGLAVIAENVF